MRIERAVCLDVMAETSANNRRRVYWTNTVMDSSSEESDAFIPGLSKPGNMRYRVKGRKTPEVKANISVDRPVESLPVGKDILVHDLSQSLDGHSQRRHARKASFKDLRMEDKKRVANLIKELAKAGDEKDQVVSQLHVERQQYETQILQLVSQQEDVLKEREDIQVKLFETQQLLQQYQEQVMQEEKQKRSRQQQQQQQRHHHHQVPRDVPGDDSVRFSPRAWRAHISEEEREANFKLDPRPLPEELNQQTGISHRPVPEFYPSNVHNPHTLPNHLTNGRPYTTLIDQEIAQERRQTDRHRDTGRHKIRSGKSLGPLREPIMSSTQKSSQIAEISFNSLPTINSENFEPLPLDSSPRTTLGFTDPVLRKNERNRVGFAERVEDLDSARVHSPVLEGNEVVGDQQFLDYYKKLTPAERKRELLRQRSALLEEQNRLKHILSEQERQLHEKQEMLNLRHQQRLRECEDVRLQVQRETEKKGERDKKQRDERNIVRNNAPVEKPVGIEEVAKRLNLSQLSSRSNSASESSGRHSATRQLKSAGTSPMNFQTRTSVGTSPLRQTQLDYEKSDLPDLVDAGTSVSYAHIARSPQQSNLPLHVNRQRTSPSRKGLPSPGDKTLAILEIVNSLDRLSDSLTGSVHSQEGSIHRSTPRSQSSDLQALDRDNPVEELEESRILEEVFFMK